MKETTPSPPTRPSRKVTRDMYEPLHPSFFTEQTDLQRTNRFTVVPTADLFFQDLTRQIEQATETIDLQFYTLEADREVSKIINASTEAAERGVEVRILVDHIVSDPRQLRATLEADRRINNTPNMEMKRVRVAEGLANIAIRDHKKIVAIDTRSGNPEGCAYIGGVNLTERSLRWNDFMVKMQGSIAALVQQDFEDSWSGNNHQAKRTEDMNEQETYLLTDTAYGEETVKLALERIAGANERIWLETPYLDMATVGAALCRAKEAKPELDIRVIIPRYNNYPTDRLRAKRVCKTLRENDIDTYQYGNTYRRLNHAKLLLADDVAMFGSSNFNASSLAGKNAEIAIATKNKVIVENFETWYEEDMAESQSD